MISNLGFRGLAFILRRREKRHDLRALLVRAGLSQGQAVLDYGCGIGSYALPAARIVGAEGKVHALDIHGTNDTSVPYEWGRLTIERWAGYNGCLLVPQPGAEVLDLSMRRPGPDTFITLYEQGCLPGGSAELWSIDEGQHAGGLTRNGATTNLAVEVTDWSARSSFSVRLP